MVDKNRQDSQAEVIELSIPKNPEKLASSKSQTVEETNLPSEVQESIVTGNEDIKILKHSLNYRTGNSRRPKPCAEIAIRNISGITISNIVFEATFYDSKGNIVDIVTHNEIELKPNTSRAFPILCSKESANQPASYQIRISKMMKSDVERVQLRQHQIRTSEAGEEEVTGVVKNISNVKTDAALVATFYNSEKEKIGIKVIIMRDIEPENYRKFHFVFTPQVGDMVSTYTLSVVPDIEEC